jgi:lactoylglutathione lyase
VTDKPGTQITDARRPVSPLAMAVADSSEGVVVTQMLIVADVARSVAFYRDVLGASVERQDAPAMLQLHDGWIVINVGGGPTDDKPTISLAPPVDRNEASAFFNIRVADIEATYRAWSARGAEFITEPRRRGSEIRCYLQDPDGYRSTSGKPSHADPNRWRGPGHITGAGYVIEVRNVFPHDPRACASRGARSK